MSLRIKLMCGVAAVLAIGFLFASPVRSQEKPKDKPAAQPPAKSEGDEMMAKWAEMNAKGPEHARLAKMVGNFATETKWWMAPGTEAQVSKGTAKFELLLDGRYIQQTYKCPDMMGQPFTGIGIEGFDKIKGKYVSIWMDSMSTGFMKSEGTASADGKTVTYLSDKADDPMTGQKDKVIKSICHVNSDDNVVFDMFDTGPDGKEFKCMEITYTRQK